MVISHNSQLGLRFSKREVKVACMTIIKDELENDINGLDEILSKTRERIDFVTALKEKMQTTPELVTIEEKERFQILNNEQNEDDYIIPTDENYKEVWNKVATNIDMVQVVEDSDSKYFFICDSVYKAAELIKINTGFTGRTLKDISFGKYTYLMGKDKMVRFVVAPKVISGIYYDEKNKKAFQFGCDIESGGYAFKEGYDREFSQIMQVLTFVELGDIEVVELKSGRNNGGQKNKDKVTNTSPNTVFVVDSSWNKLIIRTDGFAVRGHFRLQPCGVNHADRKLLWIDAFEKHGYTRQPKAKIIHD